MAMIEPRGGIDPVRTGSIEVVVIFYFSSEIRLLAWDEWSRRSQVTSDERGREGGYVFFFKLKTTKAVALTIWGDKWQADCLLKNRKTAISFLTLVRFTIRPGLKKADQHIKGESKLSRHSGWGLEGLQEEEGLKHTNQGFVTSIFKRTVLR